MCSQLVTCLLPREVCDLLTLVSLLFVFFLYRLFRYAQNQRNWVLHPALSPVGFISFFFQNYDFLWRHFLEDREGLRWLSFSRTRFPRCMNNTWLFRSAAQNRFSFFFLRDIITCISPSNMILFVRSPWFLCVWLINIPAAVSTFTSFSYILENAELTF